MATRRRFAGWEAGLWHACVAFAPVALVLAGCATPYALMPTPVLYTGEQGKPLFTHVAEDRRMSPLDLLYVTDRAPAKSSDEGGPYSALRSRHLAFGSTTVEFGDRLTWDTLAAQSTSVDRKVTINLKLGTTKELGRFPRVPYAITHTAAGISRTSDVIAAHEAAKSEFRAEIASRIAVAPRKEVVLFVHGYAYTFEEAALTMGELCHFLGREFVCGMFSWPAGGASVLFGYDVDRESAEFATEDLKRTIRMIADTPSVQRIHLVAHSRGTDLLATALSDLSAEAYITQTTLARRFKIGNVVLIAPDIDIDVAPSKIWKIVSEPDLPYGSAPDPGVIVPTPESFHITVYASPDDKALATAGWWLGSLARLGRVDSDVLPPEDVEQLRTFALFDVIHVRGASCFVCHSYFVSNPRVSSDLIAMLRYGLKPGEPGRPLIEVAKPFWRVPTAAELRVTP
jgi:esterase/lipase superfamily enzyme